MKILKITTVFAFILFLSVTVKAQNIIVKAGLTSADMKMSDSSGSLDKFNKSKKNVHFGVFMDRKINDLLSFETGLMFDQKGVKQIIEIGSTTMTNVLSLSTLNLPVSLKVGLDASEDIRIFGKIGGYGGYSIGGKIASKIADSSGTVLSDTSNDIQFGSDPASGDELKPIDYGAAFGVGIQYKRLSFELGFDLGLANLAADQSSNQSSKNREFKFTLGYHFGK